MVRCCNIVVVSLQAKLSNMKKRWRRPALLMSDYSGNWLEAVKIREQFLMMIEMEHELEVKFG